MNARRLEVRWLLATVVALVALIAPVSASAGPPSNDNFANAEVLTGRFGWTYGDSTGATKEPGEPNHAGNPGGASLWYAWTAPSAGLMTIDLCYAEFDTLLAVYTGTGFASESTRWLLPARGDVSPDWVAASGTAPYTCTGGFDGRVRWAVTSLVDDELALVVLSDDCNPNVGHYYWEVYPASCP